MGYVMLCEMKCVYSIFSSQFVVYLQAGNVVQCTLHLHASAQAKAHVLEHFIVLVRGRERASVQSKQANEAIQQINIVGHMLGEK